MIGAIETGLFTNVFLLHTPGYLLSPSGIALFAMLGLMLLLKIIIEMQDIQDHTRPKSASNNKASDREEDNMYYRHPFFMHLALIITAACILFATMPFLRSYYALSATILTPAIPGLLFISAFLIFNTVHMLKWADEHQNILEASNRCLSISAYMAAFFGMDTLAELVIAPKPEQHHESSSQGQVGVEPINSKPNSAYQKLYTAFQTLLECRPIILTLFILMAFVLEPLSLIANANLFFGLAMSLCILYGMDFTTF